MEAKLPRYQNLPVYTEFQQFQHALKLKRDSPGMYSKMCVVSVNGKPKVETRVQAENGFITIFGTTMELRNRVKSLKNEEEKSKSVAIESNDNHVFDTVEIYFPNSNEKFMFLLVLGDLFDESATPSPESDESTDSGL